MKILIFLLISFVSVVHAGTPVDSVIVDPYVEAHRKRDVDALMALVEFSPDTPASIVEQTRISFQQSLDLKIVSVRVLPLDDEDQKSLSALSKLSDPTLKPIAKFVVTWDVSTQSGPAKTPSLTKFLGIKEGRYRFVTARKKAAEPGATDNPGDAQ